MPRARKALSKLRVRWIACGLVLGLPNTSYSQVTLPEPVLTECWLVATDINSFIKPAQSTVARNVPHNNEFPNDVGENGHNHDCRFHRAAIRMFLWLTARLKEGRNDSYVFNSKPLFYDVPGPPGGHRGMLPASAALANSLNVTIAQSGPGGITTVFDDTGRMHIVVQPVHVQATEMAPARNIQDFTVEDDGLTIKVRAGLHTFIVKNEAQPLTLGQPKLLDKDGKVIAFGGKTTSVNEMPLPLDRDDRVVDYNPGQAGRIQRVLMTEDRRLVYYGIRVNDVYRRFHQTFNNASPKKFPSTKQEVDDLQRDKHLLGAKALTVAVKTSWIDVCYGLSYHECGEARKTYREKYLTLDANIPTYTPSPPPPAPPTLLVRQKKEKPTTLALLGMHVAFTVPGFPGMLWSTFEHVNNARNVRYAYWDPAQHDQWQKEDGGGKWLLAGSDISCRDDNVETANRPRMVMSGRNIIAVNKHTTIGPSNVCRKSPWGTYHPSEFYYYRVRNPTMIAINRSLQKAFEAHAPADDVRNNYLLLGATWWLPGDEMAPRSNVDHKGVNALTNSTMETFQQSAKTNCLTCHRDDNPKAPLLNVSHIWRQLHPTKPPRTR